MWYGVTCIMRTKLWSWKHGYAVAEQWMDGLWHPLGGSRSLQRVLMRSYVIPTCSHGTFLYNAAVMLLHTLATLQTAFFIPIGWLGSQSSSGKLPFSVGGSYCRDSKLVKMRGVRTGACSGSKLDLVSLHGPLRDHSGGEGGKPVRARVSRDML